MRVLKRILPGTATAITLAALTACYTPGVTLVDSDVSAAPDSVTFIVRLEDSTLAAALGWTGGVPGAVIMLHRIGDDFHPACLFMAYCQGTTEWRPIAY
jgi:hypothetical protein